MTGRVYRTFDELPDWARSRIRRFRPNDADTWVFEPVPALDNQSFIDVINQGEDGANALKRYLNDLIGKFFAED